jgi:hypothetical protein
MLDATLLGELLQRKELAVPALAGERGFGEGAVRSDSLIQRRFQVFHCNARRAKSLTERIASVANNISVRAKLQLQIIKPVNGGRTDCLCAPMLEASRRSRLVGGRWKF